MSAWEELTASNPTHPTVVTIRSGVTRDGRLTARQVRTVHASGAYGAMKPRSFLSTSHYVGGGYRVPHTSFEFLQVYTNTTPGGYFRAPGAHQYTFALECHTDLLARALGMDPAIFRRMNLVGPGEEDAVGRPLRVAAVRQVLDAALAAGRWGEPKAGPGRGKGVAIFGRQIGGGAAGAVVTAEADGTFTVLSPTVDVGTGTHTIVQQIVATEMDVPLSWVRVRQGDTDSTPFDEGPRASRVTYTEGHAVMQACARMRQAIQDGATLPLTMTVEHEAPQPADVMYFSAQVAEVDVDRETGQVKVLNVVTAHEVGTVINPLTHQGQIDGGFVTGLGLAVTEELVSEGGQILNGHFGEYKLPTIADIPPLRPSSCRPAAGRDRIRRRPLGNGPTTPRPPPSRMPSPPPSGVSYSSCRSPPSAFTRRCTRARGLKLPDGTNRRKGTALRCSTSGQHLPRQEQQDTQGLVLGGCGCPAIDCSMPWWLAQPRARVQPQVHPAAEGVPLRRDGDCLANDVQVAPALGQAAGALERRAATVLFPPPLWRRGSTAALYRGRRARDVEN